MKKKISLDKKIKEIAGLYQEYKDFKKMSEFTGKSNPQSFSLDDKMEGINPFYKSDTFNYG